jgi:endonuclease G
VPRELASSGEQAERHAFLQQTLPSTDDSDIACERVLNGNEWQPVNYLERGRVAAGAIARIAINDARGRTAGWATGFLVAPRVLLTNNHVLEAAAAARFSEAHFAYELDLADRLGDPARFALRPDELFFTREALDFSVVAVEPVSRDGRGRGRAESFQLADDGLDLGIFQLVDVQQLVRDALDQ